MAMLLCGSLPNASAVAFPIPELPPVIKTVLPFNPVFIPIIFLFSEFLCPKLTIWAKSSVKNTTGKGNKIVWERHGLFNKKSGSHTILKCTGAHTGDTLKIFGEVGLIVIPGFQPNISQAERWVFNQ